MTAKQAALYTTLFGSAFAAAAYRGYCAGSGIPAPHSLDLLLIGAPLPAGLITSSFGPDKKKYKDVRGTGNGAADALVLVASAGYSVLESGVHGVFGAAGTLGAEAVGFACGYVVGKY